MTSDFVDYCELLFVMFLKALVKKKRWIFPLKQVISVGSPLIIKCGGTQTNRWIFNNNSFKLTVNGHVFVTQANWKDQGTYYCWNNGKSMLESSVIVAGDIFTIDIERPNGV